MTPGTEKLPGLSDRKEGGFIAQHRETLRSAEEGADTIVWMAASPTVAPESLLLFFRPETGDELFCWQVREQSGKFWFDRRQVHTAFPLTGGYSLLLDCHACNPKKEVDLGPSSRTVTECNTKKKVDSGPSRRDGVEQNGETNDMGSV